MAYRLLILAADEDELHERERMRILRKRLRDNSNPFEISEERFRELFRLPRASAINLTEMISPFVLPSIRTSRVPLHLRVLAALRFFASGCYQRSIGQDFFMGMSQSVISRCITEISHLIVDHLANNFINFPTAAQYPAIKEKFMERFNFPGVIGAVDGTHVAITNPGRERAHAYLNRKDYFSKNVMIVCDADLKILLLNARHAGATHDAFIWRSSSLYDELSRRFTEGVHHSWLIGDSGYPLQPFLLTPVHHPPENSPQERYNRAHIQARNCVERCIGVLKTRFRCLLSDRVLKYDPQKAGSIITACVVLHNIMIQQRVPLEDIDLDINNDDDNVVNPPLEDIVLINEARRIQNNLFLTVFN